MAAKVKADPADALKRAEQWSGVLLTALEHPTMDRRGHVCFNAPVVWPCGQPVSRGWPKAGQGVLTLSDLATIARCLQTLIKEGQGGLK